MPARDVAGIRIIDIIEAVRSQQTGRLQLDMHSQPCASDIMREVDAAIRDKLSARSLKELIAASQPQGSDIRCSYRTLTQIDQNSG